MMTQRFSNRLALAGLIGPLLFTVLVIIQGLLQPDYSHIAMPISALAAWPYGWLQNLNFATTSLLHAAFVVSLHRAIPPARFGLAGIGLLLLTSVGLMTVAFAPWVRQNGELVEPPLHVLGAVLTFLCASAGLVALSRRMAADAGWHRFANYTLGTGVVMFVLFIVVGFFSIEEGTPFHAWSGALQRMLVAVWFAWMITTAWRAVRPAATG